MKRFLALFVLLMLGAGTVYGGWNIRQNEDGGASWINDLSETVGVGDTGLVVRITDVGTASTTFILSPRKGTITRAYVVIGLAMPANSNAPGIDLVILDEYGVYHAVSTVSTGQSTGLLFTPATFAPATDRDGGSGSYSPVSTNTVSAGTVIAVHTGGEGSNGGDARVIIIIE